MSRKHRSSTGGLNVLHMFFIWGAKHGLVEAKSPQVPPLGCPFPLQDLFKRVRHPKFRSRKSPSLTITASPTFLKRGPSLQAPPPPWPSSGSSPSTASPHPPPPQSAASAWRETAADDRDPLWKTKMFQERNL